MNRTILLAAAFLGLMAVAAQAQPGIGQASVVAACGAQTYPAGTARATTQDTTGTLCTAGSSAASPTVIAPLGVSTTDRAGTLTAGGVAQTAMASNASRKGWCIQNPVTASETMNVRANGTASATVGVVLSAGAQACNIPGTTDTALISVYAATTGHTWLGFEQQ